MPSPHHQPSPFVRLAEAYRQKLIRRPDLLVIDGL